jgi:hypothetical protein
MSEARRRKPAGTEPAQTAANPPPQHRLVGAGVHFNDENDCVRHQAVILDIVPSNDAAVGDLALLQYFDWLMGNPTTQRLVALSEMASSEQWVFYTDYEEMNDHYERVDAPRNEFIRNALKKPPVLTDPPQ